MDGCVNALDGAGYYKMTGPTGGGVRHVVCTAIAAAIAGEPAKRALVILATEKLVHEFRQTLRAITPNCTFGALGDKVQVQTATVAKIIGRLDRLFATDYAIVVVDELFPSQEKYVDAIIHQFSDETPVLHVVFDPSLEKVAVERVGPALVPSI